MTDAAAPIDEKAIAKAARAEIKRRRQLQKQKKKCEDDLVEFIRTFWHCLEPSTPFVEGWVIYTLADYLMAAAEGHIKRGIINVFPGSAKSLTLNVFFCAWLWGPCNRPHERFICASYNEDLPDRDNGRFLHLIEDPLYQQMWGDRFRLTKKSVSWIANDKTGWKRTTSTHAGTTGHRGTFILIDDGNDPNNVESEKVRSTTIHWAREVMPDRLDDMDTGVIINLQQRVHTHDVTGILAEFGTGYTAHWVCIPMLFDPLRSIPVILRYDDDGNPSEIWVDPRGTDDDGNELEGIFVDPKDGKRKIREGSPMAKAEGSLAWPERFSPEAVASLKKIKGPFGFSGQYQQAPSPRGGGIIQDDWWLPWNKKQFPDMGTTILSLVPAFEEGAEDANHAATVWGAFPHEEEGHPLLMLINSWKDRAPLAQLVTRVAELASKHKVDYLLIQNKEKASAIYDEILRLYSDVSWTTLVVPVGGTAYSRLQSVSVLFSGDVRRMPALGTTAGFRDVWSGGMVYAPNTDWADEVITAVSSYPRGTQTNVVDSVSQALSWCRKFGVVVRKVEYDAAKNETMKFRPPMKAPYAI